VDPITVVGVAVVAVLSITTHEASHGFAANRLGDPTAREMGRLTLNPIPHIDLFFTILLPAFLILSRSGFIFGGAKPVPVNVSRLRNPRRDWALVGAAGPLSNLAIAVFLSALLSLFVHLGLAGPASNSTEVLAVGISVNVLLAIFNLVPIPPLDGSRVVQYFLAGEVLAAYRRLEQFGLLVVLALVLFVPPVQLILTVAILSTIELLAAGFGVSEEVRAVLRRLLFPAAG
jgi:Zn-dependent protease